jgi:O-antigen ligase
MLFIAALLLPPLPFAIGNTGPHPALAIAGLGLCAGFIRLREWRWNPGVLGISMISVFAVLLCSVALAAIYSGFAIAIGSLARVLLFGIAVYTFLYVAHGPGAYDDSQIRSNTRILLFAACGSALFACIDRYFQFPAPAGYGPQFVWLDSGVFRRAQGVFYEASTLGNLCAFFLVMIFVALFRKGGWTPCSRKLLLAGAVLFSAALILSYSRASLLNLLAALAAFAYLQRVRIGRTLLMIAGVAGAAVAIVYGAFPAFAYNYWMRISATVQFFFSSPEGVLSGRIASWTTLSGFLMAHPWHALVGIGYKTLPYSDFAGHPVIADNMYLSLLVETGIVGLIVFAVFNAALLLAAFRAARASDPVRAFFGSWMFCFWAGELLQMFSGDLLTYWRVLPIYFWVLAVAVRDENPFSRSV